MSSTANSIDIFTAIAEPRRREILGLLAQGVERDVTELVNTLGLPQPAVSKHLSVLRQVGLVAAQKSGQRRLYRLQPKELKPLHDWVRQFETLWTDHLGSIKAAAEQKAKERVARDRTAPAQQLSPKRQRHDR